LGSTTSLTLQNPVIECGLNPDIGYNRSRCHLSEKAPKSTPNFF